MNLPCPTRTQLLLSCQFYLMSSPVTRTRRSPRNHHTDIVNTTEQIKKKRRVSIPSSSVAKTEKVKTEKVKTEKVKTEKAKAARVKTERDSTCIPPPNWQIVYDTLESFREITKAPVDTMGCERLADPTASPKDQRFQTLIALMLSSQTKDTVTSVAVRKLQNELEGGLTLETILAIDETRLDQFIKTVGFHAKKASYIKRAAEILRDQYAGDIPDTIEGLTSLPGVGPKMGYLTLQVAWNMNLGIGVDVHVHRICNRLGWVKTNTPEETRMSLQSWLPKDKWRKINTIMVGFGQLICLPRGPQCETCPVKQYCPSAEIKKVIKKQKKEATTSVYFKQEPVNSALDW